MKGRGERKRERGGEEGREEEREGRNIVGREGGKASIRERNEQKGK